MTDAAVAEQLPLETGAVPVPSTENPRVDGVVKFFDASKGFGFIKRSDGERDVFLHVKELRRSGIVALNDGAAVNVQWNEGERGPFATDIKIVPSNPS